jgi:hypothetical protein
MTEKSIGGKTRKRVIADMLEALGEHNVPVIQDFIREENAKRGLRIPVGGLKDNVIANIKSNLDKSDGIPAEDLLDYVDRLRENGNQHVFLYQLTANHRDHLKELRKPETIKRWLASNHLPDCYNKPLLIWESRSPQIAAIIRRNEPIDMLIFKWVETRVHKVWKEIGKGKYITEYVRKRAVTYFRINLENGDSELCIHELGTSAKKTLLDEREKYIALLQPLIEIDNFQLVTLEPAIHTLIIAPPSNAKIVEWNILLPEGKSLEGKRNPDLSQWLGMLWNTYAGDRLNIDWPIQGNVTKIKLDAQVNELKFKEFLDFENAIQVIKAIRRYSNNRIENPSLNKIADEGTSSGALIKELDTYITKLQMNNMDCEGLITDGGVSFEALSGVLDKLNSEFPHIFNNRYQVICPNTRKPVKDENGDPLEFGNADQIPVRVHCKEPKQTRKVSHPTKGNIRPILSYAEPPKTPLGDGIVKWADQPKGFIDRMENSLGKVIGRKVIKSLFLLVFASLYAGLIYLVVDNFMPLINQYPNQGVLVVIPYFLILLLMIVLLVALFGVKTIEKSITFMKLIIKNIPRIGVSVQGVEAHDKPKAMRLHPSHRKPRMNRVRA